MDAIFFYCSKFLWLLIEPDNLITLGFVITLILLLTQRDKLAKKLLYPLTTITLIIAIFPVGSWLIYPLETHFDTQPQLPEKVDGIILLGGSFITSTSQYWGNIQTNDFADRIHQFITLMRRYPNAKAVFTGGNANPIHHRPSEAHYAKQLFSLMGVDHGQILYETQARNTFENALFSKEIAKPKADEHWIVISTAWHLPRVVGVFCKQQWPVIPYPADFHTDPRYLFTPDIDLGDHLNLLNFGTREWLGLLVYYLTGKTTELLPKQCY